jgi:hypothetical protein
MIYEKRKEDLAEKPLSVCECRQCPKNNQASLDDRPDLEGKI